MRLALVIEKHHKNLQQLRSAGVFQDMVRTRGERGGRPRTQRDSRFSFYFQAARTFEDIQKFTPGPGLPGVNRTRREFEGNDIPILPRSFDDLTLQGRNGLRLLRRGVERTTAADDQRR